MKKLYVSFICIFLASSLFGQTTGLTIQTYLELAHSSLSTISSNLRIKGYSLAYTRDYTGNALENPVKPKDIAFSINATYNEFSALWELKSKNYSYIKMLFDESEVKIFTYTFTSSLVYKNFTDNLKSFAFRKDYEGASDEGNSLYALYKNESKNEYISVDSYTNGSYSVTWQKGTVE